MKNLVKVGIRNFFVNFKFIYIPLLALALGLIIGSAIMFSGIKTQFQASITATQSISQDIQIDKNKINQNARKTLQKLNWANPFEAFRTTMSVEWLNNELLPNIKGCISNYDNYKTQIDATFQNNQAKLKSSYRYLCYVFGFFLVAGFLIAKASVREKIAFLSIKNKLLLVCLDFAITASIYAICAYVATLWKPSLLFTTLVGMIVYGFISLIEAYIFHANKKIKFKQVVNLKNTFFIYTTTFIIYLISISLISIGALTKNDFIAFCIAYPVYVISVIVISLNSESYVVELTHRETNRKGIENKA